MIKRLAKNNTNIAIWAIIALGVALRLYFVVRYGNGLTLQSDDWGYRDTANVLLDTGVLTHNYTTPSVFVMPAYPLFLAALFKLFGQDAGQIVARVIQIAAWGAGIYYVWLIARRLVRREAWALLPAALLALYPPSVITPGLLLTETFFTTLLAVAAYLSIRFLDEPGVSLALKLGLTLVAAIYLRPVAAVLPFPVFLIFVLKKYGDKVPFARKLRLAAVCAGVIALCLAPWWIRNYRVFHEFIPLSKSSGNPMLYGTYIDYEGIVNGTRSDWPEGESDYESDALQTQLALQRIKAGFANDFGGYLRWYTIGKARYLIQYPFDWFVAKEFPSSYNIGFHYLLMILGSAGLLAYIIKRPRDHHTVLIFILLNSAGYLVYVTSARYFYPQLFLLCAYIAVLGDTLHAFAERYRLVKGRS